MAILALSLAATLTACDPHTIDLGFDPSVGDTFRFRSTIQTEVARVVDGRADEPISETATLEASESVTSVDDDAVTIDVSITRDGAPARDYTARFARGQHLTAADLIEGAAADAVGLDLAANLPSDLASPPDGPLEPGARWSISRQVETGNGTIVVTGQGRVRALGVEKGRDVAVVEVDLRVPIQSSLNNPNGVVHLEGTQTSRSRTTYDIVEGTVQRDQTTLDGEVTFVLEPPSGVRAEPVPGSIIYSVTTNTQRVADD